MQGDTLAQKQVKAKKKYAMSHYKIKSDQSTDSNQFFTPSKRLDTCVCQHRDRRLLKCFKCINEVHYCINMMRSNRGDQYQCHQCLNYSLDPLYQIRKVYISSFFKTNNVFKGANIVNFQFTVTAEDKKHLIEIRGLSAQSTSLSWPMHGAFFINNEEIPFYDIRPLMSNSNRKARRQQYFPLPADSIMIGKNRVKFVIYKLDKERFTNKYQYQQTGLYFMSINSIVRVDEDQLIRDTLKKRKCTKKESLDILHKSFNEIQITSERLSLVCPYTRNRIKFPVRGKYCKHFNCVCLSTLIVTHVSGRFWNCPICQQKLNEPYVDSWMLEMLNDKQQGTDVLIKPNGTYSWIKAQHKTINAIDQSDDSNKDILKIKSQHNYIKVQDEPQLTTQQAMVSKNVVVKQQRQFVEQKSINIEQIQRARQLEQQIATQLINQMKIQGRITNKSVEKLKRIKQQKKKQLTTFHQNTLSRPRQKVPQMINTPQKVIKTTVIDLQLQQMDHQEQLINQLRRQNFTETQIQQVIENIRKRPIQQIISDIQSRRQSAKIQLQKQRKQAVVSHKKIQKQVKPIIITDIQMKRITKMKDEQVRKYIRLPKTRLLKIHQDYLNKHHNNVNNLFKDLIK